MLEVDASETGGGTTLMQEQKPIGFFSTKWNSTEKNYTTTEKETYTIIKALDHFNTILFAASVDIHTDSANTLWNKPLTQRTQR